MTRARVAGLLFLLGAMSAVIVFASVQARRHRFDMAAHLAELARREGTWDNQWDKIPEKLAELYRQLLADPSTSAEGALAYRWLMNIAYMTLGEYPQQVPPQWLIPPEALK